MIIHECGGPIEVPTVKAPQMEAKKYIIVKNHVREFIVNDENDGSNQENPLVPEKIVNKKLKKSTNKRKNTDESSSTTGSDNNTDNPATKISKSDLEELKTVYRKCKDIVNKIEKKYGHLLDLDDEAGPSRQYNYKSDNLDVKCNCSANKKIIFDDNGEQTLTETVLDKHVCPEKLKRRHSTTFTDNRNLEIEYEEPITLPDDLQSLNTILQDPNIEKTYRNKVINKIKTMKQERMNDIKFDKPFLIQKLKLGSNDIFDFNGSNVQSLPGYPVWK